MRSLVLGAGGLVGHAVAVECQRRGWSTCALSRQQADITDAARLLQWVGEVVPDVVFNCAAFTLVDDCEEQRDVAMAVNGEALSNVVEMASAATARLIHLSTDYVFDGRSASAYSESSTTAPLSVYGRSKLRGEEIALDYGRALVVRTSWLFGPGGKNFVDSMRQRLELAAEPLRVVDDQHGCPTYTPYLARALCDLAEHSCLGVVHYCNREATTWYRLTLEIARTVAPQAEIVPVTTDEYPTLAPRPANSVLAVDRFENLMQRQVEPWRRGLAAYLAAPIADPQHR